jgi:hypothetical protein
MTNPSPSLILGNQSRPLLTGLDQAGVDLGSEVIAAHKTQREALTFVGPYQAAAAAALAGLRAPGANFAKQSAALVKATAELQAAQLANATVQSAAEESLLGAINARLGEYADQLVEMFSAIVAEHRLNDVSGYLPDFTVDGMHLDILSLSGTQAEAVLAWKQASEQLHGVWAGYVRLARFVGFELGPVGDSLWANRLTAVCLGAVTSGQSMTAGQVFVAADANVEQTRQIRALLPFIAAPIAGFELTLVPVDEADSRLRQFGHVTAPGSISVGV